MSIGRRGDDDSSITHLLNSISFQRYFVPRICRLYASLPSFHQVVFAACVVLFTDRNSRQMNIPIRLTVAIVAELNLGTELNRPERTKGPNCEAVHMNIELVFVLCCVVLWGAPFWPSKGDDDGAAKAKAHRLVLRLERTGRHFKIYKFLLKEGEEKDICHTENILTQTRAPCFSCYSSYCVVFRI